MQTVSEVQVSKLRQIREALGVSRDDVLRRTKSITLGTIRNAELGKNRIRTDKATEILDAINCLLRDANQPPVTLADLQLALYEEASAVS